MKSQTNQHSGYLIFAVLSIMCLLYFTIIQEGSKFLPSCLVEVPIQGQVINWCLAVVVDSSHIQHHSSVFIAWCHHQDTAAVLTQFQCFLHNGIVHWHQSSLTDTHRHVFEAHLGLG